MLAQLDKVLAHKDGTPAELRSWLCYALKAREVGDKQIQNRGDRMLKDLAELKRDHFLIYEARIALAFRLMSFERFEEADRWLTRIPPSDEQRHERAWHIRERLRDPDSIIWTALNAKQPEGLTERLPELPALKEKQ